MGSHESVITPHYCSVIELMVWYVVNVYEDTDTFRSLFSYCGEGILKAL